MSKLYLASKSQSRKNLLQQSKIPFYILDQNADETACNWGLPLKQLVESIAISKMEHSILPNNLQDGEQIIVLTADTLGLNSEGQICGKPVSRDDAITKIKSYRNGAITGTAICLEKKVFKNGRFETLQRILDYAQAQYIFDVPDNLLDWYLENGFPGSSYINASGSVEIEGLGQLFVKELQGSFTAVLGLPMYELRISLSKLDFNVFK